MKVVYNIFDDVGHNLIIFFYRGNLDPIDNENKQKVRKDISLPTRRSKHRGNSIHGDEAENTNGQLPDISDNHVQGVCEKLAHSEEAELQEIIYSQRKDLKSHLRRFVCNLLSHLLWTRRNQFSLLPQKAHQLHLLQVRC